MLCEPGQLDATGENDGKGDTLVLYLYYVNGQAVATVVPGSFL